MLDSPSIESIKDEMLALEPDARVQLARALAVSLEGLPPNQRTELWLAETERRDAEMESGAVEGVPGEEVFARIESRHIK